MQIGDKKITFTIDVQPTDRRPSRLPIKLRWNWLNQWTQYKIGALVMCCIGLICIYAAIITLTSNKTSIIPWYLWIVMSLQARSAVPLIQRHRALLLWKLELSEQKGQTNGTF